MNRRTLHYVELFLTAALIGASICCAVKGNWAAGQYFLVAAGVVEIDDLLHPFKSTTVAKNENIWKAFDTADRIIHDLDDRRGLKHEWRQIDGEIQDEIRSRWATIIKEALDA